MKGEYGMGLCDVTSAPCAYITILREPIERLMSFYKYICLQGSENFGDWPEDWDREDEKGCPLNLVDFFNPAGGAVMVDDSDANEAWAWLQGILFD